MTTVRRVSCPPAPTPGSPALVLLLTLLAASLAETVRPAAAQSGPEPDLQTAPLTVAPSSTIERMYRVGAGVGFLVTTGEGFDDRPDVAIEGAIQLGRARPGAGPVLGFTVAFTTGAAHFMGGTYTSIRALGGVELPWALSRRVELVPSAQLGYLKAFEQDERRGFTSRWSIGLRVLPEGTAFYFGFEPIALVTLPRPDPADGTDPGSALAPELGVLRFGWRF